MNKVISFILGILIMWFIIGVVIIGIPSNTETSNSSVTTYSLPQDAEFCKSHKSSIICENN